MFEKKLYTPEGMHDILFERCYIKKNIESNIRRIFYSNGYMEIETPSVEFYNVFEGNNTIPEESLFKLVDEKGRIIALRPEMTVPTARVAATKLKDMKLPLKISYLGKCFRYDEFGGGKQREFTQAGIEIIGSSDAFTDSLVISTAIEAILGSGIKDFTIELGQVEFFKGLMEEAGISKKEAEEIREMIEKKDFFGLEELMKGINTKGDIKDHMLSLPQYFGGKEMLLKVKEKNLNERSKKAIDNLLEILDILEEFNISQYISVDLGMISKLSYYTGIIFRGLTYGVGFPILGGGRYDNLCEGYGKNMSATGFSMDIDMILTSLYRNNLNKEIPKADGIICFDKNSRKTAVSISKILKEQKLNIELFNSTDIDYIKEYARERNTMGIIYIRNEDEILLYNLEDGTINKTGINQLMKGENIV